VGPGEKKIFETPRAEEVKILRAHGDLLPNSLWGWHQRVGDVFLGPAVEEGSSRKKRQSLKTANLDPPLHGRKRGLGKKKKATPQA